MRPSPASARCRGARCAFRLPEPVNDVLKLASVVGSEFGARRCSHGRASGRSATSSSRWIRPSTPDWSTSHPVAEGRTASRMPSSVRRCTESWNGAEGAAPRPCRHGHGTAGRRARAPAMLAEHFTRAAALGTGPKPSSTRRPRATMQPRTWRSRTRRPTSNRPSNSTTNTHRTTRRRGWSSSSAWPRRAPASTRPWLSTPHCMPSTRHASGSPQQFGRAVAVFAEPMSSTVYPDQVATLLDEAQHRLGDDDRALLARLMAIEAFKYSAYQLQGRDGRALADRAVQLAREAGEAPTLTAGPLRAQRSVSSQRHERPSGAALGEELVALGLGRGWSGARATTHGLRLSSPVCSSSSATPSRSPRRSPTSPVPAKSGGGSRPWSTKPSGGPRKRCWKDASTTSGPTGATCDATHGGTAPSPVSRTHRRTTWRVRAGHPCRRRRTARADVDGELTEHLCARPRSWSRSSTPPTRPPRCTPSTC